MIDDHERGCMPAARDVAPLHIVTVCVRGRDTYGLLASGRRANAIARIQQVIAAAGQDRQGPGLGSGRIIRSGR
ncbi:hypothetical protein [Bosea sp. (in: a-proteobacteria)]|uniref:hypothetical protein n=1 Tax=Bosea sp. (in: a-proteobacteria) TaxID=1871050 RepID=UPI001AD27B96|nr:hypothetical protein [Bosea sp. (in: a-proteobacteria)]MBN9438715.1 hypothetical protein [Bosea sp. (in: a-proteobacteria)]